MDEQTNFTREHADDGIHDRMHNVAPFGIVLLTLLAFFIMGFIEVCL